MYSIHIHPRAGKIAVNVNRWGQNGPYPAVLIEFDMDEVEGQSELGMLARVGRCVYAEAMERIHNR